MNSKPDIILVTRNFPPMQGGMERLNLHVHEALRGNYAVHLIGPEGAERYCGDGGLVQTRPPLPVWRFLAWGFWRTLRLALTRRPRLIIAGSGVAALPAVLAGRLAGVPVLTYLHGLDIVSAHPLYRRIFVPAIRRSTAWLANSRFTRRAAIRAGIPPEKIDILPPGTDLPELSRLEGGKEFRRRIQAGDRPILLSVGRLTRRKGLLEFIERAFPEIVRQCPDVLLVIIGGEPTQSVAGSAEPMREKLRARLAELGLEANARILGGVDEATLREAYGASQLHVFPVLDLPGDAEGFGMVAVEAAAHGLPTVAFDVGGVSDAVEQGVSGWLLPSGDYAGFAEMVIRYLRHPPPADETRTACRRHAERFAWPRFGEGLLKACSRTVAPRQRLQLGFSNQLPGVAFDQASREVKAKKVLAVLQDCLGSLGGLNLLDIGCSGGLMTRCYSQRFRYVAAIDVDAPAVIHAANRNSAPNLNYSIMNSESLAFLDSSFDVVTCTHIYEHVPDAHGLMAEIYRVLKPGGICFFSAGNRLSLIEPHYRLPLLSVIPKWSAHWYLRLLNRGNEYYETHLTYWGLKRLVNRFEVIDYTKKVIAEPERYQADDMLISGSYK